MGPSIAKGSPGRDGPRSLICPAPPPRHPRRFSDGRYGALHVARTFETALFETLHHHARFMLQTREVPGWTSQFREIRLTVAAGLHDLTVSSLKDRPALFPDICAASQALGRSLRESGLNGIVDPSVRHAGGRCVLFCPDCASEPVQSRYLHTHWDGERLDLVRKLARGQLFRVLEAAG